MTPTISTPLRLLVLSAPGVPGIICFRGNSDILSKCLACQAKASGVLILRIELTRSTDVDNYDIKTSYYSASIPIWRDTLPLITPTIDTFQEEWKKSEAGEVVQAVGAWVLSFKKPKDKEDLASIRSALATIHAVIEHHASSSYSTNEALLFAVGMQQSVSPSLEMEDEEWEDLCRGCGGWEWIDGEVGGEEEDKRTVKRNEFGEKVGIARLQEALEAHEWEGGNDVDALSDDLGLGSEDGFDTEAAQMEGELMGLKMAVHGQGVSEEGGDDGVEEMDNIMLKVMAIKDMAEDMPAGERRKFAAKAVGDVIKKM